MIPKVIIQTSKLRPENYVLNQLMSKANGWKYIHFNDDDIIQFFKDHYIEEFKDIISCFYRFPRGEHRADLFRYYYLYLYGGVFIDSDAMIQVPLDDIIKDYDFFSVDSTIIPNSIFQGFIGTIPNSTIIYKALQNAYTIDISLLQKEYHQLCINLYNIVVNEKNNYKIRLYGEDWHTLDCFKVVDQITNHIILLHYWKYKRIPFSL